MRVISVLFPAALVWLPGFFLQAQTTLPPVVTPRGVINAFTQQPAPSVVAPGGILWINGLNLGPPEGLKANAIPLPTELGDPPIRVMINNRLAPLYSVATNRIVAQVPYEIPNGLATITVQRGEQRSRPARVNILASVPSIASADGSGYGSALLRQSTGTSFTLGVSGLGITEPRLGNGDVTPADAAPRGQLSVFVGGLPAAFTAAVSPERVGEFDIRVETPEGAMPGDPIRVVQSGRAANAVTLPAERAGAEVLYMPIPPAVADLRSIQSTDLRGLYIGVSSLRNAADGCFKGWAIDMARKTSALLGECLVANNAQAATPFAPANEGAALAAFVGPAQGNLQEGISSKLVIANAAKQERVMVDLPGKASIIATAADGNFIAILPGPPAQAVLIDSNSGEVREAPAGAQLGGLNLGGGAPGGGGNVAIGPGIPSVDLGDGINKLLAMPIGVPQQLRAVVVGDNTENPTKAKIALVNPLNEVQQTADFPADWLPLAAPLQPLPPNLPPGGIANLVRFTVSVQFDGPTRRLLVVARKRDNSAHGLVAFPLEAGAAVETRAFPAGQFAAACSPNIRLFNVELVRRIGLLSSPQADREFRQNCSASGFILVSLDTLEAEAIPLPGAGEFSATQGTNELNDYIYGSNSDPTRQGSADTLYLLDGVTASAFRMDLPPGVNAFANLRPVPGTNLLIGLARAGNVNGDAGLVVFDLDRGTAQVLPTPDGFIALQIVDLFPATRKVVARGTRQGGAGTQFLVYDLITGDLQAPPNPPGVAFVGAPPAGMPGGPGGPGGGGGMNPGPAVPAITFGANVRANTVEAITYSSDRQPTGLLVLRVN